MAGVSILRSRYVKCLPVRETLWTQDSWKLWIPTFSIFQVHWHLFVTDLFIRPFAPSTAHSSTVYLSSVMTFNVQTGVMNSHLTTAEENKHFTSSISFCISCVPLQLVCRKWSFSGGLRKHNRELEINKDFYNTVTYTRSLWIKSV